jgi:hypothetical protein
LLKESKSLEELENSTELIEIHARHAFMSFRFAEETDGLVSLPNLSYPDSLTPDLKLSKVLDARRDEILLQTNAAMQANLDILKSIAFIAGEENKKLSKISSNTLKDSNTLKALTTIATMYLPASLTAVSIARTLKCSRNPTHVEFRQYLARIW